MKDEDAREMAETDPGEPVARVIGTPDKPLVNWRSTMVLLQAFFGYTGVGRIYGCSYLIGIVQLAFFTAGLVLLSQTAVNESTFAGAMTLIVGTTIIWIIDSITVASWIWRLDPQPVFSSSYRWTSAPFDVMGSKLFSFAFIIAIPVYIMFWLSKVN
nr:hypothetical protein [Sicyoidochytrium minutum DNA virus]